MTVKELIQELLKYDENLEVCVDDYCNMTRTSLYKVEKEFGYLNGWACKNEIRKERIIING